LFQYMEYEADGGAANLIIHQSLNRLCVTHMISGSYRGDVSSCEHEITDILGILLAFYFIGNLHWISDRRYFERPEQAIALSHPPYFVRLMTVLGSLAVYKDRWPGLRFAQNGN